MTEQERRLDAALETLSARLTSVALAMGDLQHAAIEARRAADDLRIAYRGLEERPPPE